MSQILNSTAAVFGALVIHPLEVYAMYYHNRDTNQLCPRQRHLHEAVSIAVEVTDTAIQNMRQAAEESKP